MTSDVRQPDQIRDNQARKDPIGLPEAGASGGSQDYRELMAKCQVLKDQS